MLTPLFQIGCALCVALGTPPRAPIYATVQDSTITPEMVALGEKIFRGKAAGGLCFSCHGPNALGVKGLAPSLADSVWLHGDGSFVFIQQIVERGVPKPKQFGAPMPPKGGAPLGPDHIKAVAAYVYSLRTKR